MRQEWPELQALCSQFCKDKIFYFLFSVLEEKPSIFTGSSGKNTYWIKQMVRDKQGRKGDKYGVRSCRHDRSTADPWTSLSYPANPKHYSHPFLPANYLDGISAFGSSHEAVYIGKRWNACRYHELTTLHLRHTAHSNTLRKSRKGCYSRTASKGDLLNYKIQLLVPFPVFQEQSLSDDLEDQWLTRERKEHP